MMIRMWKAIRLCKVRQVMLIMESVFLEAEGDALDAVAKE